MILELLKSNVKYVVVLALLCVVSYFVYYQVVNTVPTWLEHKITQSVQNGIDIRYNEFAQKIEVQGKKLDTLGSVLANTHYVVSPGMLEQLFSKQAREQKQYRDSLLALIPKVVATEFKNAGVRPGELGVTTVVVDSVYIEVQVGNSAKFTRGYLKYVPEGNKYVLNLYPDSIDIVEVRSKPQEDGTLLSTVTARSRLTGAQYKAESNRYFLDWEDPKWDFHPYITGGVGIMLPYDNGLRGSGFAGLDWIQYKDHYWDWRVAQFQARPDGLHIETKIAYKLF